MNFPENLKYSKDHEWISVDGNSALVGITDFAQCELGEIVYVDITTEGDSFAQHEVFGNIEAVKTVSDLFVPVSCQIVEVNPELDANPELVNQDPYGKGWLVKVEISNLSDLDSLMSAAEYKAFIAK